MSDKKNDSVQKARFIKRENTQSRNGHPSTKITYMWLKDDGTEVQRDAQWVNQYLNEDSKKIYENLKEGSEFLVVKEDNNGKYWFKELRDVATYVPKPVWNGNDKSSNTRQSWSKSNYDPYGATIGMIFNNAILSCLKEGPYERSKVLSLAKNILEDVREFDSYARPILEQSKNNIQEENKLQQESHMQDMSSDDNIPF